MARLDQMLGTGREINGYHLATLCPDIINAMILHYENLPLDRAKKELAEYGEVYSQSRKEAIIDDARSKMLAFRKVVDRGELDVEKIESITTAWTNYMSSMAGVCFILWLLLKDNEGMTEEKAAKIVELTGLEEVQELIDRASFPTPDPRQKKTDQEASLKPSGEGFFASCRRSMGSLLKRLADYLLPN